MQTQFRNQDTTLIQYLCQVGFIIRPLVDERQVKVRAFWPILMPSSSKQRHFVTDLCACRRWRYLLEWGTDARFSCICNIYFQTNWTDVVAQRNSIHHPSSGFESRVTHKTVAQETRVSSQIISWSYPSTFCAPNKHLQHFPKLNCILFVPKLNQTKVLPNPCVTAARTGWKPLWGQLSVTRSDTKGYLKHPCRTPRAHIKRSASDELSCSLIWEKLTWSQISFRSFIHNIAKAFVRQTNQAKNSFQPQEFTLERSQSLPRYKKWPLVRSSASTLCWQIKPAAKSSNLRCCISSYRWHSIINCIREMDGLLWVCFS